MQHTLQYVCIAAQSALVVFDPALHWRASSPRGDSSRANRAILEEQNGVSQTRLLRWVD